MIERRLLLGLGLAVACAKGEGAPPVVPASAAAAGGAATTAAAKVSPRRGCDHKGYVAPAGAKPAITIAARGALLDVTFENHGTAPACLFTHVATNGEHFDWITVEVGGGAGPTRSLTFVDDRREAASVSFELEPGERVTKTIDLGAWAKRRMNGARALAPGGYSVSLTYDSSRESTAWAGTLQGSTILRVP